MTEKFGVFYYDGNCNKFAVRPFFPTDVEGATYDVEEYANPVNFGLDDDFMINAVMPLPQNIRLPFKVYSIGDEEPVQEYLLGEWDVSKDG